MLNLTEKGVEVFIKKASNIEPYWDNYDLVIWKKDQSAYTNIKGMFRNLKIQLKIFVLKNEVISITSIDTDPTKSKLFILSKIKVFIILLAISDSIN